MSLDPTCPIGRIHAAILWAEGHLGERIAVADIARRACYSPFHFHRTFTALTGEPVVEYVRRRRLSVAADLLRRTDRPILAIALDAGFESQEAFTRAFKQQIGTTPGRFRRDGMVPSGAMRAPWTPESLEQLGGGVPMEPVLVDRPSFHVAGLSGRFTTEDTSGIPPLWGRFVSAWCTAGRPFPPRCYGICVDEGAAAPEGAAAFSYMAAVEIESLADAPPALETRTVPANRYAVFTSPGGIPSFHETYRYVFGTWLPHSGFRRAEGPDFELYDERFDPETHQGEIDVYVPVAPAPLAG